MLLIAMLILAACGTSGEENGKTGTTPNKQEPLENLDEGEVEGDADKEDNAEDEDLAEDANNEQESDDETDLSGEDNTTAEQKSDDFQTNAKQVDSDAQDFTMHILPEYTLTSEEPGKDSLYVTDDGNIFMRIETMPFDQETYDYFKENTLSLLESIKADGETVVEANPLPYGENIKDTVGYTVKANENMLTGYVFERDGLLVHLTIFDTLDGEHFNDFLQMGETITSK